MATSRLPVAESRLLVDGLSWVALQAGSVSLNPTTKGWSLGYDGGQNFRDVQLSQAATVDVSGVGGGDIEVQARSLQLSEGSKTGGLNFGDGVRRSDISVNASKSVELIGTGTFASDTLRFASWHSWARVTCATVCSP